MLRDSPSHHNVRRSDPYGYQDLASSRANGQDDPEEHDEMPGAVRVGGFVQGVRDGLQEHPVDDYVSGRNGAGKNQRPDRVHEAQGEDHRTVGYQPAREEHRDRREHHDQLLSPEIPEDEGVI